MPVSTFEMNECSTLCIIFPLGRVQIQKASLGEKKPGPALRPAFVFGVHCHTTPEQGGRPGFFCCLFWRRDSRLPGSANRHGQRRHVTSQNNGYCFVFLLLQTGGCLAPPQIGQATKKSLFSSPVAHFLDPPLNSPSRDVCSSPTGNVLNDALSASSLIESDFEVVEGAGRWAECRSLLLLFYSCA